VAWRDPAPSTRRAIVPGDRHREAVEPTDAMGENRNGGLWSCESTASNPQFPEVIIAMDPTAPADTPDMYDAHPAGLVARLRDRTRDLHREAERSGILRELLHRRASRAGYALLLRNLHPVYAAMEGALILHRGAPGVRRIPHGLGRMHAIESDLRALAGEDWETTLPLLKAAAGYAVQIVTSVQRLPGTLIAHAYVRYLGDLSGGQVLKRLLAEAPGLAADELSFYDFGGEVGTASRTAAYLGAIDAAGRELQPRLEEIVEESAEAFRWNIRLSEAVFEAVNAGR
jgi:heme oxygenase (biliverdin-producing, ferredoxin)